MTHEDEYSTIYGHKEREQRVLVPNVPAHVCGEWLLQRTLTERKNIADALQIIQTQYTPGMSFKYSDIGGFIRELSEGFTAVQRTLYLLRYAPKIEAVSMSTGWELQFPGQPYHKRSLRNYPIQDGTFTLSNAKYPQFRAALTHTIHNHAARLGYTGLIAASDVPDEMRRAAEIIDDQKDMLTQAIKHLEAKDTPQGIMYTPNSLTFTVAEGRITSNPHFPDRPFMDIP